MKQSAPNQLPWLGHYRAHKARPSPPDEYPRGRQKGADENEVDQASVYGGGETGYTDYPFLQE